MLAVSLYAVAVTLGLCLYWVLHSTAARRFLAAHEDHAQIEAEVKDDVSAESRRDSHSLRPSVSGGRKAQLREVRLPDRGTPALQLLTSEGVTLAVAPAARPPGEEADTRGGGATGSDSVVDMVSQLSKPVDRRAQQDKLLDRAPEKLLESRVANNNNSTFNNNNNNNNAGGSPVTSVVTQHGRRSEVITATVLSGHKEVTPVHLALHARGGHQERNQDKGNSPLEKKTRSRDSPRSREKMIIPDERFASLEESIRSSQPNRRNQDKLFDRVHEKCLDVRIQGPLRGGDSSEGTAANGSPFAVQPPPAVPPRRSPSSDPKPPPRPPPKRSVAAPAVSDENGVDDEAELQRITERIAGHVNLAIAETPCPESLQPPRPCSRKGRSGLHRGRCELVDGGGYWSAGVLDEPLLEPGDDLDHVAQQQPGSVAVQDCDPADPRRGGAWSSETAALARVALAALFASSQDGVVEEELFWRSAVMDGGRASLPPHFSDSLVLMRLSTGAQPARRKRDERPASADPAYPFLSLSRLLRENGSVCETRMEPPRKAIH
ncbi:hypothetical protein MRX96_038145 [Rhipicephalus microplus]